MLSRALLAPRSIAIVGASADPSKVAGRPLQYLRQAGYAGTIYPINARRDAVLGERAWPSLAALPEAPDHAFILAGADGVLDAVRDCAARGVKVATILATGFAEAGHEGLQRV
ncbi:MAG: CoA-binding protein, partial [Rhizobiales bacterium]|nr:CoA-binding protein [Hyphomicrobiales bacterium]